MSARAAVINMRFAAEGVFEQSGKAVSSHGYRS